MAIHELSAEQVRTLSPEEKDRWWLEQVFRGDMPQLTLRSAITGMILGAVLSLTNLYVGAKTGWTLGVGITSVVLAFALFKVMASLGLARDFTVLENNCMQSIATAAGYMTSPLVSSLAAYMLVTQRVLPASQMLPWMIAIALLGVLFAFPLKRRFINVEQHPFPEGRAAGIVMDALHGEDSREGVFKAKILAVVGALAALIKFGQAERIIHAIAEKLHSAKPPVIPEFIDGPFYWLCDKIGWKPAILGTSLQQLTVRPELDVAMIGAGGLMGIRVGVSLLVGAVVNYCILAPWMIQAGEIVGQAAADGTVAYGFRRITTWSLWCGVSMMTTASLLAFFAKPRLILGAFSGLLGGRARAARDCLAHIELPMGVFLVGIPVVGAAVVYLAHSYFGVRWYLGVIAIPLVFVFALIGANSTALTSITPSGPLGKLTQLTYGVLAPGNATTNLMTASITGEVAMNASNLLMDIKPGYMLGGKPRHQAIGHVLGILAGGFTAVFVFHLVFVRGDVNNLCTEANPMPAATVWKAVAELLASGLSNLKSSARWAAAIGALAGILMELIQLKSRGRFPLTAVGVGLAFVIPFPTCLAMFFGAFFFWAAGKLSRRPAGTANRILVQNQETVAAAVVAGAALMGIAVAVLDTLVLR